VRENAQQVRQPDAKLEEKGPWRKRWRKSEEKGPGKGARLNNRKRGKGARLNN